jgi:farnesyl-diphosphate farnesyltransferase
MPDLTPFGTGISDSERVLLEKAAELHRLLGASPDRAEIVRVLEVILSGQSLDLTRFACGAAALTKADELEDYTYRVAGCVGEFWTRICDRHLADYSSVALSQMAQWGVSFGKGLQLINILRDAPMDLAQGRCYLPLEELPDRNPERLKTAPESARPVTERWTLRAREHLDDGLRYIEAVRPWRLRLACFLPWAIGIRTLRRMEQTPPLEQAERVKIGRREVRALFFLGVLASFGNRFLRRVARRVQAD